MLISKDYIKPKAHFQKLCTNCSFRRRYKFTDSFKGSAAGCSYACKTYTVRLKKNVSF